jgi:hypothetical protein
MGMCRRALTAHIRPCRDGKPTCNCYHYDRDGIPYQKLSEFWGLNIAERAVVWNTYYHALTLLGKPLLQWPGKVQEYYFWLSSCKRPGIETGKTCAALEALPCKYYVAPWCASVNLCGTCRRMAFGYVLTRDLWCSFCTSSLKSACTMPSQLSGRRQ